VLSGNGKAAGILGDSLGDSARVAELVNEPSERQMILRDRVQMPP
jgi:hypothetical protein